MLVSLFEFYDIVIIRRKLEWKYLVSSLHFIDSIYFFIYSRNLSNLDPNYDYPSFRGLPGITWEPAIPLDLLGLRYSRDGRRYLLGRVGFSRDLELSLSLPLGSSRAR